MMSFKLENNIDEFIRELDGMAASVSVVDPAQDPYVPGPEKKEHDDAAQETGGANTQPAASENWICVNCGKENSGKFCTDCGTVKPWICPTCGKSYTTNFCPEDGTPKP